MPAPRLLDKVAVAFELVRYDANMRGDKDADTAIARASFGPLRGDWFFRGGDFLHAPTSYARFQRDWNSGDVLVTFVCEDTAAVCNELRRRAEERADRLASGPTPPLPSVLPGWPAYSPPPSQPPMAPRTDPLDFWHDDDVEATCRRCEPPTISRAMVQANSGGTVLLWVSWDANGVVTEVRIHHSSGNVALDAAAQQAVIGWRINPGTMDGRRVAGKAVVPVQLDPPAEAK